MPDIKISQLTQTVTPKDDDLIAVSQDAGGGNYLSKSTKLSNLKKSISALGDKESGNYVEIEADGTLVFKGNATVWGELRSFLSSSKEGGSKIPTFKKVIDDGAGSQGVFGYHFDALQEQELYFNIQLAHRWKLGSIIYPHIHWCPVDNNTGSVSWGLEYTRASIDSTFGNTTIISVSDPAGGVAYKHHVVDLGSGIGGAGETMSNLFLCRIFRDATGVLGIDNYPSDVLGISFDMCFEMDTVGSREYSVK